MRHRSLFLWTALLLCLGLLLRAVFSRKHPGFAGDTLLYGDLAQNMLLHHIYGFTEATGIRPTLIRLPGYPAFLALCFRLFGIEHYTAVLWVQIALDLLNCWLLGRLAARVMGRRVGWVAMGLAALCPFTANYSAVALTETWCLLCVTLALLSLDNWTERARAGEPWNLWLLGLTFSLAFSVLLRPDQSLLALAVLPAMLRAARRLGVPTMTPVAAVCAGLLLPLALWGARNWRVFHVIQPLAPKYANDPGEAVSYGFYRWYRTWAVEYKSNLDFYWTYDGEPIHLRDLPPRAFDTPQQEAKTAAIFASYNRETASTPSVEKAFSELAAERERNHPLRTFVALPLARLADMWLRPRTEFMRLPLDWWRWREHPAGSALATAYSLLNLALLWAALTGLRRWWRLQWNGHGALAAAALGYVLLRCALLLTLDNSEPRYTIECFPVILLLASFAFSQDRSRISGRAPRD